MREALEAQLYAGNVEVNIVGDFKAEELDDLLVKYLGTIEPVASPPHRVEDNIDVSFPAKEIRQQEWHLKDSDERAAAYIAGKYSHRGAVGDSMIGFQEYSIYPCLMRLAGNQQAWQIKASGTPWSALTFLCAWNPSIGTL